tara:strand:- start:99 stop:287 length:189 start_codon:yes stop_codon:yes gene_type:complete
MTNDYIVILSHPDGVQMNGPLPEGKEGLHTEKFLLRKAYDSINQRLHEIEKLLDQEEETEES